MGKTIHSAEVIFVNRSDTLRGFHESRTLHFEAEHERDGFLYLLRNQNQVEVIRATALPFDRKLYETSQLAFRDLLAASDRGLK